MSEQDGLVEHFVMVQDAMVAYKRRAEVAEAEVERLKGVLEFYAKKDNWADHFDRNTGASYTPAGRDGGAIARSALEAKP